jgi:HEAT repeat protein
MAWLYAAGGLIFAGVVVLLTHFALCPGDVGRATYTTRPAAPVPSAANAAQRPVSQPPSLLSAVFNTPPVEDQKFDSAVPVSLLDTVTDPPPVTASTAEPPPAANATSPKRTRTILTEDELRRQLRHTPEFGLTTATRDALAESYKKNYQSNAALSRRPTFDPSILLSRLPSARELPIRGFPVCQLSADSAATLGVLARALHAYLDGLAPKDANGKRGDPIHVREVLRRERRGKPPAWLRPEALPAMVQILMAEDVPLRLILVDMMADIPGRAASVRLAQRAVYDVSGDVRHAAIDALRQRPIGEFRRTLVDALRYPWPPVADHAADVLAALGDRDAAPLLVALLEKPDPVVPYATKTGMAIHELVRVNHLQNCLLCHVPAVGRDPVTDVDPFAHRPTQTYETGYRGPTIPGSSGGVWANRVLIRADVQFLRQDFSVTLPPEITYSSAGAVRFDFLIRTRPLKPAEVQEWKYRPAAPDYPQREATLSALRAVTGEDAGSTTEAWLKLYPHAHAEAEGVRLAAALRAAPPDQREQLLARYRDAKAAHYTEGLAHAIPHVSAKFQEKVRAALVERLARLPTDELRPYLDAEGELHRAAAWACVRTADAELIPDLIDLLTDADAQVVEAARQALRRLMGDDFDALANRPNGNQLR